MTLTEESALIGRYLLGVAPSPELAKRYAAAHQFLELDPEEPELRFLHRNPRLLPFLDAAAGLLRPCSTLRKKVFLMAAILEATPEHVDFFLRKPAGLWVTLATLVWQGSRCAGKLLLGIPLFLLARRVG
jgi:hypothetical protein